MLWDRRETGVSTFSLPPPPSNQKMSKYCYGESCAAAWDCKSTAWMPAIARDGSCTVSASDSTPWGQTQAGMIGDCRTDDIFLTLSKSRHLFPKPLLYHYYFIFYLGEHRELSTAHSQPHTCRPLYWESPRYLRTLTTL